MPTSSVQTISLYFKQGASDKEYHASIEPKDGGHVVWDVLHGPDFGLAQTRSRLVLLASRLGAITLPKPTHRGHTERFPT